MFLYYKHKRVSKQGNKNKALSGFVQLSEILQAFRIGRQTIIYLPKCQVIYYEVFFPQQYGQSPLTIMAQLYIAFSSDFCIKQKDKMQHVMYGSTMEIPKCIIV